MTTPANAPAAPEPMTAEEIAELRRLISLEALCREQHNVGSRYEGSADYYAAESRDARNALERAAIANFARLLSFAEHHARLVEENGRLSKAAVDVTAERRRQVESEGWTPEHDDEHHNGEMAYAAACYALSDYGSIPLSGTVSIGPAAEILWPWEPCWWKPKERRYDLVRAAALLIAEIDRLDRAALTSSATKAEGDADV